MKNMISKSKFKPRALHFFRMVQQTGRELIISDHGKPVLKIMPYKDNSDNVPASLRNTVRKYLDPMEPIGLDEWENLK